MLSCADMYCCVSVNVVSRTPQRDKLYVDLTIRACDDLACSEELSPKHGSVRIRYIEYFKQA